MMVPAVLFEVDLAQASQLVHARANPFRRRQRNSPISLSSVICKSVISFRVVTNEALDLIFSDEDKIDEDGFLYFSDRKQDGAVGADH